MKIERSSTSRLVKPCTTTDIGPPLLVPLSNSDLAMAPVYAETIYAYNAPAPPTAALEEGLRKVLCEYREWAGRLTPDVPSGCRPAIELNDAGALLVEAEAHGCLQELWPFNPSPLLLDLVPITRHGRTPELLLVQVTRFTCGGVIVGTAMQHQVADGLGALEFMEAWAALVRGLPIACPPLHDRTALMGRDHPQPVFDHLEYQKTPPIHPTDYAGCSVKKLHFSPQLLKKIKAKAAVSGAGGNVVYSTFVSLFVHIWKCITIARGLEDEEGETTALLSLNMRERLNPPLPKNYFGNALCITNMQATIKDLVNKPLSFAANIVHEAIRNVNDNYARSAFDFIELKRKMKDPVHVALPDKRGISVTSWVGLPLYKVDFGWGTPMFAGAPFVPLEGLIFFTPSHKQDGSIDVLLGLFAPYMEKLEAICYN